MTSMQGHTASNKAKGQISKYWLQENKVRQIFQESNISYPPPPLIRTHTVC